MTQDEVADAYQAWVEQKRAVEAAKPDKPVDVPVTFSEHEALIVGDLINIVLNGKQPIIQQRDKVTLGAVLSKIDASMLEQKTLG